MEKKQRSKPEQKKACSLKLNKETLRQLEALQLKDVAGGNDTLATYCHPNPCYFL